jgi:hypothetical protein
MWRRRNPPFDRADLRHGQSFVGAVFAEILLVDFPIFADEERHDSGILVFRGVGENSEVTGLGEDSIVVAVEQCWVIAGVGSDGFGEIAKLAERARGVGGRGPANTTRSAYPGR